MPIIRDTTKTQHDLTDFHYGELPKEGLASGLQTGDMFVWDGTQWQFARVFGGAGIRVDYNQGTGNIEISLDALRSEDSFVGDAVLQAEVGNAFTGDAELV